MRMRSHRRSLMVWSPPGGPADRYGALAFTRHARPRPIRWWLRTGALLTVIGITRIARAMRARWRSVFTVTGGLLLVIGFMLPNGGAFVAGLLVLVLALLRGAAAPSHCRAAAQMTGAHWHG
jgi:hypothetical protein